MNLHCCYFTIEANLTINARAFKSICIVCRSLTMWTCCAAIRNAKTSLVVISFVRRSQPNAGHLGDTGTQTQPRLGGPPVADTKYYHRHSAKSIRGQCRWSLATGGTLYCHGDGAAADNWAWDSVATKQHGLSNEINDVVLGLVSPRRGLSPNSPPKVKERTITETQIHQAHSLFRLSSK